MLKVTRVLHAGTIFESGSTRVLVDPIFENPFSLSCHAFPGVEFDLQALTQERFDAIVISHYHDDHCSFESLKLLDRRTPLYMFCLHEDMFSLLRELGFTEVHPLKLRGTVEIRDLQITAWPALDRDVDCLLQITDGHSQVLNVVDSWIDFETVAELSKTPWDLVLWPFQTMLEMDVLSPSRAKPASRELPPEWIEQLKSLSPSAVVPSSCQFIQEPGSWMRLRYFPISYAQFENEVRMVLPQTQILRLDPGMSVSLGSFENSNHLISDSGTSSACSLSIQLNTLKFLRPLSESSDVDYDYNFETEVPTLASVADRLGPVTDEIRAVVADFLATGLAKRFAELQETEEAYFQKPRIWLLRLYEPNGVKRDFTFKVTGSRLMSLPHSSSQSNLATTDWLTEIPTVKIVSALMNGESLSSLLVRINDQRLSDEAEAELFNTDFLTDPLLRVLYEDRFASYQKAQLKRIRGEK